MHAVVQSAINAAKQGDKIQAVEYIKQVLTANPKDVDAWLVLAAVVDEPERKRQCLNRVLSLDPTNRVARESLLEMDRAAMKGMPPFTLEPASISTPKPLATPSRSTHYSSMTPAFESAPAPQQAVHVILPADLQAAPQSISRPEPKPRLEKPLVFRPSSFWLVIFYLFAAVFGCMGILVASQSVANSLPLFALALLFGLPALSLTSKVEVSEAGIRTAALPGGTNIEWNDISKIKSNSIKKRLELVSNKGKSVNISTQVKGYPVVIELLRQKRPDLFGESISSGSRGSLSAEGYEQPRSTRHTDSISAPAFTGTKTFRKSFFKQYGLIFLMIPLCLLMIWLGFADPRLILASLLSAAFCVLVMIIPFFQVSSIKVEPNRMVIQTFFEEKELSASQIKEIKMQSIRGRYGRVTNVVNIIPVEGKRYPLGGFSEGDEILYGFLMNWWNTYKNR